MVVSSKLDTSILEALELDLLMWLECAQTQERVEIQEPTNISLNLFKLGVFVIILEVIKIFQCFHTQF
jgi:hypothetical protein